jgi:hypothetical protein
MSVGCSWTISANVGWISFNGPTSGVSAGAEILEVPYTIQSNPLAVPRHGSLTVQYNGRQISAPVHQNSSSCQYAVSATPSNPASFSADGGTLSATVTPTPGDCWSWFNYYGNFLRVLSYAGGDATPLSFTFNVLPNTGSSRSGFIDLLNGIYPTEVSFGEIHVDQAAASSVITVATQPVGLGIAVDGVSYTTPQVFTWEVGSSHMIATTSPLGSGGTRYVFANWSDGGAIIESRII